jgi:hypothetical protein
MHFWRDYIEVLHQLSTACGASDANALRAQAVLPSLSSALSVLPSLCTSDTYSTLQATHFTPHVKQNVDAVSYLIRFESVLQRVSYPLSLLRVRSWPLLAPDVLVWSDPAMLMQASDTLSFYYDDYYMLHASKSILC